ncbi:MAG: ribosomal protein S18-alanine N-acetyltransferase [Methanopyri archaeon]|nr:ribosomal protein S18-alanine N-acetyltransferase [Methanopyri archaeon]
MTGAEGVRYTDRYGNPILVRRAKKSDLPRITEIEELAFPKSPYPTYVFLWNLSCNPEGFLVAERCGEVAGYIIFETRPLSGEGHIVSIAVHPDHRRVGVGTVLMAEAERRIAEAGYDVVRLEVRESNFGARRFYERLGYRPERRVPRYYDDGETAIVMVKELRRDEEASPSRRVDR